MRAGIWSFVFGSSEDDDPPMLEQEEFRLKYDGEALRDHSFEVNDLAPALLALSDLLKEANAIANGEEATLSVKVKATTPGSFDITIQAKQYVDEAIALLSGNTATALANLMAILGIAGGVPGVIWLTRKLKGGAPDKVTDINSDEVEIETKGGTLRVGKLVWQFYNSRTIRKSIFGIIKPLENAGIETVELSKEKSVLFSKEDLPVFTPPEEAKERLPETPARDVYVNVVHMWFKGAHKWKFSEGGSEWTAEITDAEFLNKVANGEISIRANDFLQVRVKQTQFVQGSTILSSYEITKVLGHKAAGDQLTLL